MKKLFLTATIGAALIAVGPASAQVHFGAGPAGVGVEVGPDLTLVGIVTTSATVLLMTAAAESCMSVP